MGTVPEKAIQQVENYYGQILNRVHKLGIEKNTFVYYSVDHYCPR
jgi:hypothetical protein